MRFIAGILIVLSAILLILIYSQNGDGKSDEVLVLKLSGIEKNIPDLSIYGSTNITTKRGDTYLAFSILEILIASGEQDENFTKIIFHSSDGVSLAVSMDEINDLYLVEHKIGELKYLRLVIPTDDFPQRWMKYISLVEFTND